MELNSKDNLLENISQNDKLLQNKLKGDSNLDNDKEYKMINFFEYENSKLKVELDEYCNIIKIKNETIEQLKNDQKNLEDILSKSCDPNVLIRILENENEMNLIKNSLNRLRSDSNLFIEHDNILNEKNNKLMLLEYN